MKKFRFSAFIAIVMIFVLLAPTALAAKVKTANGGGSLYLRKGPGTDYGANGTVHDGDYISVVSYGDIWSKVKTNSGRTGYIKNLYIKDGDSNYASGTNYFGSSFRVYTTASVNMRSGASTGTAVIRTLSKGTKLTALGSNNGFYLVKTSSGTQGYVSSKYLSKSSSGSSSSSSSSSGTTKRVTASYVNVRSGGGMSYDVVCVLPRNTKVTVLKKGNYWTKVRYKSYTGWIKNTYLR